VLLRTHLEWQNFVLFTIISYHLTIQNKWCHTWFHESAPSHKIQEWGPLQILKRIRTPLVDAITLLRANLLQIEEYQKLIWTTHCIVKIRPNLVNLVLQGEVRSPKKILPNAQGLSSLNSTGSMAWFKAHRRCKMAKIGFHSFSWRWQLKDPLLT
jgi:hypothetical protein